MVTCCVHDKHVRNRVDVGVPVRDQSEFEWRIAVWELGARGTIVTSVVYEDHSDERSGTGEWGEDVDGCKWVDVEATCLGDVGVRRCRFGAAMEMTAKGGEQHHRRKGSNVLWEVL